MNKIIIYEYINRLKREDILKFCSMRGLIIDNNDLDTIYDYIKNDYKRFFNNPDEVIYEVKEKVSPRTFNEIINLYDKYKNKIK